MMVYPDDGECKLLCSIKEGTSSCVTIVYPSGILRMGGSVTGFQTKVTLRSGCVQVVSVW